MTDEPEPEPTELEVAYSEQIDCGKLAALLATPSVLLVLAQGLPGYGRR